VKMTKVYIILLNYNGWRDTQECLESVIKLDYPNYQIIVVDNLSPNDSMSHLIAWAKGEELSTVDNVDLAHLSTPHCKKPVEFVLYDKQTALNGGNTVKETLLKNPIIFIQAGENRGFAAGNNIGTQFALKKNDADYIWYLNNDTVIQSNTLTEYINKAAVYKSNGQKVGIIGGKLMYYHHPKLIQSVGGMYSKWFAKTQNLGVFEKDEGQFDNEATLKKISYPIGACMLVDIDFIKNTGMMSEEYFLYFEELDWVYRGRMKNWSIGYCWEAKVFHKEGGSIGTGNKNNKNSMLSDFYGNKNRMRFTCKFNKKFIVFVWLSMLVVSINRIRSGEFKKLMNIIGIMFGKKSL